MTGRGLGIAWPAMYSWARFSKLVVVAIMCLACDAGHTDSDGPSVTRGALVTMDPILVWEFGVWPHVIHPSVVIDQQPKLEVPAGGSHVIGVDAPGVAKGWSVAYTGDHTVTPGLEVTALRLVDHQRFELTVTNQSTQPIVLHGQYTFNIKLVSNDKFQQTFAVSDELDPGVMLVGVDGHERNGTVFRTDNYGHDWHPVLAIKDNNVRFIEAITKQHLLLGTADDAQIYESHDGGDTWQKSAHLKGCTSDSTDCRVAWAGDHLDNATQPLTLIGTANRGRIMRRLDLGDAWDDLGTPFPAYKYVTTINYLRGTRASSCWVASFSHDALGPVDARVARSCDSGQDWTPGRFRYPDRQNPGQWLESTVIDDQPLVMSSTRLENGVLMVGTGGRAYDLNGNGRHDSGEPAEPAEIWRSGDEGKTWYRVFRAQGHADRVLRNFTLLGDGRVYAILQPSGNLLVSTDRGMSWTLDRDVTQHPNGPIGLSHFYSGSQEYRLILGTGCNWGTNHQECPNLSSVPRLYSIWVGSR